MKKIPFSSTLNLVRFNGCKHFVRYIVCPTIIPEESKIVVPTFRLAAHWPQRIALTDEYGDFTYRSLFNSSKELATQFTELCDGKIQERVAVLCPNNVTFVLTQWACWISGQIVVPLSNSHPINLLEYFVRDSDCKIIVTTEEFEDKIQELSEKTGVKSVIIPSHLRINALNESKNHVMIDNSKHNQNLPNLRVKGGHNPNLYARWNAQIVYTSGSTAMPKGVVVSFANLTAQINGMISAWKWTSRDVILHSLPLHHVHGIVNALLTPLHCGARCVMLPKFNAAEVWNHLLAVKAANSRRITVFTGVPTMYVKLINEYEKSLSKSTRITNFVKATCSQNIRLMMCGSAPLPTTIFEKWRGISGHRLLERYGMSEIGMALTNPYSGERKPGFVGNPLPNVKVRIVDKGTVLMEADERSAIILSKESGSKELDLSGELQIKGETVFKEYWRKMDVTRESFTPDGWFITGDTAQFADNSFKILGRLSVDIIKSGGYKISALFVESVLLQNSNISDIAVVGRPDPTWGQMVVAVIVVRENTPDVLMSIKNWAKDKLPNYSLPTKWKIVSCITRNAMGKVNKKELVRELFSEVNT